MNVCSRQSLKRVNTTLTCNPSDLVSSLQAENLLELFQIFGTLSEKGKKKEGNLKSPTTTTTRASRSEQCAANKSSRNRHPCCASRSKQWAATGKGDWTELNQLTSKLFFVRKTFSFFHHQNCIKHNLLCKNEFLEF